MNRSQARRPPRARFRAQLETLEDRLVPAALVIDGDQGGVATADHIVLRQGPSPGILQVLVNGQDQGDFNVADLTGIAINSREGDDVIDVEYRPPNVSLAIDGGAGSNTLVGPDAPNVWAVAAAGGGILDGTVSFTSVQNLVGGNDTDTFAFNEGGSISGVIDGGAGANTLDFSACTSDLQVNAWDGGSVPGRAGTIQRIGNFLAAHNNTTLVGASSPYGNVWDLTDPGLSRVTASPPSASLSFALAAPSALLTSSTITFSGFKNLVGGSTDDVFQFGDRSPTFLTIDGGAGSNTLDYTQRTADVSVNLLSQLAVMYSGPPDAGQFVASCTIINFQNVFTGSGNDILVGDQTDNVLNGGGGRNLLIGGFGADTLSGGGDGDILIGGWTVYDNDAGALRSILLSWARADWSYQDRTDYLYANFFQPYQPTGTYTNFRVLDDYGAPDTLMGFGGTDWFWASFVGTHPPLVFREVNDATAGERIDTPGPPPSYHPPGSYIAGTVQLTPTGTPVGTQLVQAPQPVGPVSVRLVSRRVGKKTKLVAEVLFTGGRPPLDVIAPYQEPGYKGIAVKPQGLSAGGTFSSLLFTARKGKRLVSRVVAV